MHTYIHTHAQLQAKDTESVESGTQKNGHMIKVQKSVEFRKL